MKTPPKQRGFLLIVALVLIVLIGTIISLTVLNFSKTQALSNVTMNSGINQEMAAQASLAAVAARLTSSQISEPNGPSERTSCGGLNDQTFTVNGTQYTLSSQYASTMNYSTGGLNQSPQLSTAMTAAQKFLCLNQTPFPNTPRQGVVRVGSELMTYTGISSAFSQCPNTSPALCGNANCSALLGITRGIAGTTAQPHARLAYVSQKQCIITATPASGSGSVAQVSSGELESGWIVGNAGTSSPTILQWNCNQNSGGSCPLTYGNTITNSNTWTAYTQSSSPANVSYNAIVAIGQSTAFLFGNGATNVYGFNIASAMPIFSSMANPGFTSTNTNYTTAYCTNDNDCWAGGTYPTGGANNYPVIVRYVSITNGPNGAQPTANWYTLPMNSTSPSNYAPSATFTAYNSTSGKQAINGIFCNPNASGPSLDCWAVGNTVGGAAYAWHWMGTAGTFRGTWTQYQLTSSSIGNLLGVSCITSSTCFAVGTNSASTSTGGTIVPLPTNSQLTSSTGTDPCQKASYLNQCPITSVFQPSVNQNFRGIFCQTQSNLALPSCWAVGDSGRIYNLTGVVNNSVTTWTWNSITSPVSVNLNAVSCINTATNCWAVGDNGTVLHWDGTKWYQVTVYQADGKTAVTAKLNAISVTGNPNATPIFSTIS